MDEIEISGVRYQKASVAAKKLGYTADYVGQLCRSGKIDAKRIGRTWYVNGASIGLHKKEFGRLNRQKTIQSVERAISNRERERRIHEPFVSSVTDSHRKHLLDVSISYREDTHPLFPNVGRVSGGEVEEHPGEGAQRKLIVEREEAPRPVIAGSTTDSDLEGVNDEQELREMLEESSVSNTFLEDTEEDELHDSDEFEVSSPYATEFSTSLAGDASERAELRYMPRRHRKSILGPTVLFVMLTLVLVTSVFLQNVWVYQSGEATLSEHPRFEVTFGIASVGTVMKELSR